MFRNRWILLVVGCFALSACFPESDPNETSGAGGAGAALGHGGAKSQGHGGHVAVGMGGTANVQQAEQAGEDTGPDPIPTPDPDPVPVDMGSAGAPDGPEPKGQCRPVHSSVALPQRVTAMSADAQSPEIVVYTQELLNDVKGHCGGCHFFGSDGGFHFTDGTFAALAPQALTAIKSEDALTAMPQGDEGDPSTGGGLAFSKRSPDDAIVALAARLNQWIAAGTPPDLFRVPNPAFGQQSAYIMSPAVGNAQTNLGSCVPDNDFAFGWGRSRHKKMDELDALFASLSKAEAGSGATPAEQLGLPVHLSDTDLFSFDSEELARYGVIAYVPNYPLWSDDSGKLRYVRVPRGESIRFDAKAQEFVLPPNTRFYKTFMKKVIDARGLARFKKIETRLIVTRPDVSEGQPTALFGTYEWNEDETDATLLTTPLHDTTPFTDHEFFYITDEPKAAAIQAKDPPPKNLTYAYEGAKILRHYAVPGKSRCLQCHMGSPHADFVLGFSPLQVWRRPLGQGGTIEPVGPDELTQLDRLIALGVITGIKSSDDIVPLEYLQAPRMPRNDHELTAQSYVFGNCGHCHNPRGYASQSVPELRDLLKFWPSNAGGGLFQFPLERYSPRITRGVEGRQIPYITPSLRDLLPFGYTHLIGIYTPKVVIDPNTLESTFLDAPWRSLIYRNTLTPFTYADDYTIFPHMPMNSAGHDCRASRLLGTWMVSIPARRKWSLIEQKASEDDLDEAASDPNAYPGGARVDNLSQPYEEVLPDDAGYSLAQADAQQRVNLFHDGLRYQTCPDNSDIVDPALLSGANSTGSPSSAGVPPADGVPDHAHWVTTDLTDRPGAWSPRRNDWEDVLVRHTFPPVSSTDAAAIAVQNAEKSLVDMLTTGGGVTFDSKLTSFVSTRVPLATWKVKSSCDLSREKTAQSYTGPTRPRWLDIGGVAPSAPIFTKLPGGAVFDMVCINCHGPKMDSQGRQADTVQMLTGGVSRVANFRTGLFGPPENPTANRERVFGPQSSATVTPDSWGARYMSWMALGGTKAQIPAAVLQLVGRSDVAGTQRPSPLLDPTALSGNMLAAAQAACGALVLDDNQAEAVDLVAGNMLGIDRHSKLYRLIQSNGDAELWRTMCTVNNPPPVLGIRVSKLGAATFDPTVVFAAAGYPASTRIGNYLGKLESTAANAVNGSYVSPDNLGPWCVMPGDGDAEIAATTDFRNKYAVVAANGVDKEPLPLCPSSLLTGILQPDDKAAWARRGAINAGFAVFYYVNQVIQGKEKAIRYNECELLSGP